MTVSPEEAPDQRTEAFKVLVNAVNILSRPGRLPTASEVRLAMRDLTYGGFSLKDLDYKRFRDFLRAAEEAGFVHLDDTRPGDVSVTTADVQAAKAATTAPAIRADLWKAFVDWNAKLSRWYDVTGDRAVMIPSEPASLEPQAYQELRQGISDNPERFIRIDPIPIRTQLSWMNKFATERADEGVRELLVDALSTPRPFKAFTTLLRRMPVEQQAWRIEFANKVREEVTHWRDSSDVPNDIQIDQKATIAQVASDSPVENSLQSGQRVRTENFPLTTALLHLSHAKADRHLASWWATLASTTQSRHTVDSQGNQDMTGSRNRREAELRQRLHAAIDRMPLEQLHELKIPIGYLFGE